MEIVIAKARQTVEIPELYCFVCFLCHLISKIQYLYLKICLLLKVLHGIEKYRKYRSIAILESLVSKKIDTQISDTFGRSSKTWLERGKYTSGKFARLALEKNPIT